jgi:hypothetical protein
MNSVFPIEALQFAELVVDPLLQVFVPLGELGGLLLGLVVERLDAQHRLDPGHQGRLVDGLGQILVGARLEPGHDVLRVGFGGHQDDRDEGEVAVALEVLADLDAVHLGHHDVEQDQVRLPFAGERQAFLAVAGRVDLVAVDRKPGFEDVAVGRVVVDDENVRRISHGSAYLGGTQGKYSRILASSLRVLTGLEK